MDIEALTDVPAGCERQGEDALSRDVADCNQCSALWQIASLVVPHDFQLADAPMRQSDGTAFAFDQSRQGDR